MKFVYVCVYLCLIVLTFGAAHGQERSLILSPISFTYHGTSDSLTNSKFRRTHLSEETTTHPGFGVGLKTENYQFLAWYFQDSFANHAGGLIGGPKWDFLTYFSVGLVGGVYVRERVPEPVRSFPVSIKLDKAEIAPMAAVTGSAKLPITESVGIEVNTATNVMLTNIQIGISIDF